MTRERIAPGSKLTVELTALVVGRPLQRDFRRVGVGPSRCRRGRHAPCSVRALDDIGPSEDAAVREFLARQSSTVR